MSRFIKLRHGLNKKKCLEETEWVDNELRCKQCGRKIAFYFILYGQIRPYIYEQFKLLTPAIKAMINKHVEELPEKQVDDAPDEWEELMDNVSTMCGVIESDSPLDDDIEDTEEEDLEYEQ